VIDMKTGRRVYAFPATRLGSPRSQSVPFNRLGADIRESGGLTMCFG
jgi:hypothetical protein